MRGLDLDHDFSHTRGHELRWVASFHSPAPMALHVAASAREAETSASFSPSTT